MSLEMLRAHGTEPAAKPPAETMARLIGCWDSGGQRLSERTGKRFTRLFQEAKHTQLTDRAGPLVALIDRSNRYHRGCREALAGIADPLGTVWPAF